MAGRHFFTVQNWALAVAIDTGVRYNETAACNGPNLRQLRDKRIWLEREIRIRNFCASCGRLNRHKGENR